MLVAGYLGASCSELSEPSPTITIAAFRSHPLPPSPTPAPAAPFLLSLTRLKGGGGGFLYAVEAATVAPPPPPPPLPPLLLLLLLLIRLACLAVARADLHLDTDGASSTAEISSWLPYVTGLLGLLVMLLAVVVEAWRQAMAVTQLSSASLATGMSASRCSTRAPSVFSRCCMEERGGQCTILWVWR